MSKAQLRMKHRWWNAGGGGGESRNGRSHKIPEQFPVYSNKRQLRAQLKTTTTVARMRPRGAAREAENRAKSGGVEPRRIREDGLGHNFVLCHFRQWQSAPTIHHACIQRARAYGRAPARCLRTQSRDRSARANIYIYMYVYVLLVPLRPERVLLAEKYVPRARFVPVYKTSCLEKESRDGRIAIVDIPSINKVSGKYVYTAKSRCTTDSIWILKLSLLLRNFVSSSYRAQHSAGNLELSFVIVKFWLCPYLMQADLGCTSIGNRINIFSSTF